MFEEQVNGKRVVASSAEELKQAVAAVKAEVAPTSPDINDPKDGNKIVSPESKHTGDTVYGAEVPEEKTVNAGKGENYKPQNAKDEPSNPKEQSEEQPKTNVKPSDSGTTKPNYNQNNKK